MNCPRPVQTGVLPLEYQSVPVVYDESGRGEAAYKIEGGFSMSNEKSLTSKTATRRRFMLAAGASAAAVAAPSVASAQGPISMRWQSTWPSKDIFHEYALDYAKKVNDMTGGDLKI